MEYEDFGITNSKNHQISYVIIVYATFFLSIIAILANLISLVYLIRFDKFRSNPKYNLIVHYLVLRLVQLISFFKSALISDSLKLIHSAQWLYKFEFLLSDFSDSSSNFILFVIWLVLMSERNLIGLKWLYTNTDESVIKKHLFFIDTRGLFLIVFYIFNFLFSFLNAHFNGLNFVCGNSHNLASYTYAVHLIPFAFWVFSLATLFWNFFGGYRDPILHNLTSVDHEYIKLIKIISVLEFIEIGANKTHEMFISFYNHDLEDFCVRLVHLILIDKLISTLCALVIMLLFLSYQNAFSFFVKIYSIKFNWRSPKDQSNIIAQNQGIYNNTFNYNNLTNV